MNRDGRVIAIGAQGNDGNGSGSGHVRVFELVDGSWVQKGEDINGENAYDQSGISISLDSSGTTIAIGASLFASGHVSVYDWGGSSSWVKRGEDINESNSRDSGWSVSLNDDGTVVAIGSPLPLKSGPTIQIINKIAEDYYPNGNAKVYEWRDGEGWIQRGATFIRDGDNKNGYGYLGYSISLNSSGDTVAIGALDERSSKGIVYVYDWNGSFTEWNLRGEIAGIGNFGSSVSISADALTFAAGAPNYFKSAGHAGVYKWGPTSSNRCQDIHEKFQYSSTKKKHCKFVGANNTVLRCGKSGVKETCPVTCATGCKCFDTPDAFNMPNGRERSCSWAFQNTAARCRNFVVQSHCPITCGICDA